MPTQEGARRIREMKARDLEIQIAAHEEAEQAILRAVSDYQEAAAKAENMAFLVHVRATAAVLEIAAAIMKKGIQELKDRRVPDPQIERVLIELYPKDPQIGCIMTVKYPKDGCIQGAPKDDNKNNRKEEA